jgi:hypothetical protein
VITFKRKPTWEIFMMEIKDIRVICHTSKEYWQMCINRNEQVELLKKVGGVKFAKKVKQKILFCPPKIA